MTEENSKSFLAIDLDGTTPVEKIDKNPLYGFWNSESRIRQSLIEYIKKAQAEGYDIVILFARHLPNARRPFGARAPLDDGIYLFDKDLKILYPKLSTATP